MTVFRGPFSRLLTPGYRKVMFDGYTEMPVEGTSVVHMETATRAYIDDINLAGFGTLVEKVEGGPITLQDPIMGNPKRYTFTTYGLGFRVTMEMYEDDLYGIVGNKLSRSLGQSVRNNFELVAFAPLNNAFNAAYTGYNPGEPLVSNSHASLDGGPALSNLVTGDFGLLTLQAALETFHNMKNERGMPIVYKPDMLVHSIGDLWNVTQVLGSEGIPDSPNNNINPVRGLGLRPKLVHYLNDPDAWFLLSSNHDIRYFDRRKPTWRSGDDLITGDAIYLVTRRNGSGWGDWRGVVGSAGA